MTPISFARRLALAPLAVCLQAAFASTPSLEPVQVTGTRQSLRVDQALAQTTVLDRADIEAFAGRSLVQLLAEQPGLQIANNGGLGRTSSVFVRGLESRHVLLLIDGVRYGTATVGTPAWDNLPLEAIERIEIVRGPLSALYGSDAVGGVVQVFTRTGTQGLQPHGVVGVGSEGHRLLGAGLRGGAGSVRYALGVQTERVRGESATNPAVPFGSYNADRDGFDQDSANGRLVWQLSPDWSIQAVGLHSKGEAQIDDGPGVDSRVGLRSQVASVQAAGRVSPGWQTTLRASRAEDAYTTLATASLFTDLGAIATVNKQLAWENQLATAAGSLLLVAERTEQAVSRPVTPFAVSARSITGLAAGLQGQAEAHHWQFALRRDRNSQFGGKTTGSAAYGFDVNPSLRLSAQLGTSFVAPSFNQLYFPNFGNPLLEPEEGLHKELGLRWHEGMHRVQLAVYQHRIRGYITSGARPVNLPRAQVEGLSLVYDLTGDGWSLSAALEALDPRNATTASAQLNRVLPRRARDLARLSGERQFGAVSVGATLRHVGDRFDNASNTTPLKAYTLLDLRADWRLAPAWKLGLSLSNATDRPYATVLGYNQPGREAFVTLRYSAP